MVVEICCIRDEIVKKIKDQQFGIIEILNQAQPTSLSKPFN